MSGSGIKGIRDAFNTVLSSAGSCKVALLDYVRQGGIEFQILSFSGTWADGTAFSIKSNRVNPKGDVIAMASATAQQLLATKGPAT